MVCQQAFQFQNCENLQILNFSQYIIFIIIFIEMSQEIIVDINGNYPFGQIQDTYSKAKIFIRKKVFYANKDEQQKLKQKIQILKQLKQTCLIKLINVLIGENQFHLIYEYIPNKYQNSKNYFQKDQIVGLKQKLLELSVSFCEKNVVTNFEIKNLGIDRFLEMRYYLDIECFNLRQNQQNNQKNVYSSQISKIFDPSISESFLNIQHTASISKTIEKNKSLNLNSDNKKLQNLPSNLNDDNKTKSNKNLDPQSNLNLKKLGSLQALNQIEQKINSLKSNNKKFSPKIRQSFKSNESLRQTIKENWKKDNDLRKMSGHTIYEPYFLKKETGKITKTPPKFVKSLKQQQATTSKPQPIQNEYYSKEPQKKNFNNQEFKERDIFFHKPQNQIIDPKKKKQPVSKKDFQQLKKGEFQNFFKSKQTYVQQFLGLLGQDKEDPLAKEYKIIKSELIIKSNKNLAVPQSQKLTNSKSFRRESKPQPKKLSTEILKKQSSKQKTEKTTEKKRSKFSQNIKNKEKNIQINNRLRSDQKKLNIKQDFIKCNSLQKFKSPESKLNDVQKVNSMRGIPSIRQEMRERLCTAFKKSDLALEKFRKNSIYSVHTQFHRK